MKKNIILILLSLIIFQSCKSSNPITVMTFNIRYDNPADGINKWDNRKELALQVFDDENIDIAGMQEVLKHQLDYFSENLPEYEVYGIGRDDGIDKGEFMPILFRKNRFELLTKNSFWLSTTPEKPGSLCWDTVCNRICSWVKLKDKKSNEVIYFFNTHFSHVSDEARRKSADMLLAEIAKIAGNSNVILTGDFNLTNDTDAYKKLIDNSAIKLFDALILSGKNLPKDACTFNGFGRDTRKIIIDYIFLSNNKVLEYKILEKNNGDIFISDHYPVIIKIN